MTKTDAPKKDWRAIIIVVLCCLLALGTALLVWDMAAFQQNRALTPRRRARDFLSFIRSPNRAIVPQSSRTAKNIQAWMTFDYLNKTYQLPPTYLKQSLNISDTRYPNLSVRRLAIDMNKNTTTTTALVEMSIRSYTTTTQP